jgi:hypothetical protein
LSEAQAGETVETFTVAVNLINKTTVVDCELKLELFAFDGWIEAIEECYDVSQTDCENERWADA